jgi:hypothetical protein
MKTFFNILQTLVKRKIKTYPDDPFLFLPINNNNIDSQYYTEDIYISFFIYNCYFKEKKLLFEDYHYRIANAKFLTFNEFINNSFYSKEIKEKVFNIFSKAQKCYHAFSRLAYIYKFKKYKIVVEDDLSLNTLKPENKNTFILLDNKSKFFFSLNDLISIIETAIGHSPNFFAEPIWPENPYNKQKLKPSTLYNIYFKMKESGRLISSLFHFFFLENFQITNFVEKYEAHIRENSIKKFIFNSPYTSLYIPILKMLKNNKYTNLLQIDEKFPKDKLVEIFRPFLYYYYIYNFDIKGSSKIHSYKLILYQKLKKFYQFNKLFGRKIIALNTNFYFKQQTTSKFNTNHIGFYDIPVKIIELYDDNFVFFNRNSRINTFLENRISVNNTFDVNYFPEESQTEDEEEGDYNSDDDDQLTILDPSENRNFQLVTSENSFLDYFLNTSYSNTRNSNTTYSNTTYSNITYSNTTYSNNSYPNISPNNTNREPIDIFQYDNNDVYNNDNDSIS